MLAATQTWVYLVELAVGAGCLIAAAAALRSKMRLVAAALLVAGVAAVAHALVAMAQGS